MADVKGVDQLKEHLERAKEHLTTTNETIKKYAGREPGNQRVFRPFDSEGAGRRLLSSALKRGIGNRSNDDAPTPKSSRGDQRVVSVAYSRLETRRRERDVHDRLGPLPKSRYDREDEEPPRRRPITISSSINRQVKEDSFDDEETERQTDRRRKFQPRASVIRVPEQRSREDAIKEMKSVNNAERDRNRRIFSGLLLNTLRNFSNDTTRADEVAKKRRNVEAKIEEKEMEKKEDMRRERADLFRARRDNQRIVRKLQQKIQSMDDFEASIKEFEKQKFFIRTRAKPHIYYLPRVMDSTSERRQARTAKEVESMIAERRSKMEEEVAELMEEEPQDPTQLLQESKPEPAAPIPKEEESSAALDFDVTEPTVGEEEEPVPVEVEVVEEDIPLPDSPPKASSPKLDVEESLEL